jgi:hypothetical protein
MLPKFFVEVCESNEVGLLGSGYGKSVVFEALANYSGFVDMIVSISVEDANIIKEMFVIWTFKSFRHSSLHQTGGFS